MKERRIIISLFAFLILTMLPRIEAGEPPSMVVQAIRRGDNVLLESLLRSGASPNTTLEDGTTPLMIAALHGDAKSVGLLLEHGADAKAVNREGVTALLRGAGDAEKVRLLLSYGADPHARSKRGRTPLHVAASHPQGADSIRQLIDAGVEPDHSAFLIGAAAAGSVDSVSTLLELGGRRGLDTALRAAAGRGHDDIVAKLLDAGANPNGGSKNNNVEPSLNIALLGEHVTTAQMLLAHGADIERRSPSKESPVMLAVYTEREDNTILEALLEKKPDLSLKNEREETAYTWARKRGHQKLVDLLTTHGAKPEDGDGAKEIPARRVALHSGNLQPLLRDAVGKSLPLMLNSSDVFLKSRESCVSCHHQNLPSLAFAMAREKGFRVDGSAVDRLIERQQENWEPRIERAYQLDNPVPVPPRFLGWGLLGWGTLGVEANATTEAMSWYLKNTQQADGRWASTSLRPPMGGNSFVGTMLATRSLQFYPPPGKRSETDAALARARAWFLNHEPHTLQDRLSQILGLAWTGSSAESLKERAGAILALQRGDGGWPQLPGLESDSWATGQALYALCTSGNLRTNEPAYGNALRFLLNTQFDDGSWYVASRTRPFQPHFDSAFPHGKHQWISVAGTAWATIAMLLALDPLDEATARDLEAAQQARARESASEFLADIVGENVKVDFTTEIKPLLERSCVNCHSGGKPKGNFRMIDREHLLRGGESGQAAVVPGKVTESQLLKLVSDLVDDMEMPPLGKRDRYPALTESEMKLLAHWIQGGAKWPEGVRLQVQE